MKWADIPKAAQWITASLAGVAALGTAGVGAYSHFQTDMEASAAHTAIRTVVTQNQQQQLDVFKQDRIDRHSREVARIEYQLLSSDLTDKQREYLQSKKQELRELIKCIREDKC